MASALDMALDDLIKNNKQSSKAGGRDKTAATTTTTTTATAGTANRSGGSRGRRGGARRNGGISLAPVRKITKRSAPRPSSNSSRFKTSQRVPDGQWEHDLFDGGAGGAHGRPNTGIETGTKLYISNLDFGVSNEDIKELFSEIGDLKRSTVHYDRSGRSKGSAEVVYSRRSDAVNAMKRYNNVQLDGKAMQIELVAKNTRAPAVPNRVETVVRTGKSVNTSRGVKATRGRGKKGRGRTRAKGQEKTAADLDAELEDYHAEAMQVS